MMAKMTKNQLIDSVSESSAVSKNDVKAVMEHMAIPARNHYSNPYIGLWVPGYPQPTRS
jgi:hypothetical protein